MAIISTNIPNAHLPRVLGGLGYKATIPDPDNPGQTIANPETGLAFIKRFYIEMTLRVVKDSEAIAAAQVAAEAKRVEVDAAVAIT